MSRTHWLVDVEIDGQAYRWAEVACSVTTAAGVVLVYRSGLGDLAAAQGDEVAVSVVDPLVAWATLAPQLDGRPCALRRWVEGTRWEQAEVYSVGEAAGVSYGSPLEAVSWTISVVQGAASLGYQVPDPSAAISYSTWPISGATTDYLVSSFSAYPVVFGYPGLIAEASASVAVMPAPLAQWPVVAAAATTYVVVGEDGAVACHG